MFTRAPVIMARMTLFPTAPMACPAVKTTIVTLPVGKDNRGFSLVELVLVLLLIGVSMAIVLPTSPRDCRIARCGVSALGLAAVARDLSSRALFDGVPQQLVVNLPQNSYLRGAHQGSALAGES